MGEILNADPETYEQLDVMFSTSSLVPWYSSRRSKILGRSQKTLPLSENFEDTFSIRKPSANNSKLGS